MKKLLFLTVVLLLCIPVLSVKAETLSARLKGYILLQVEEHGEAWYINPDDAKRYYMKDGAVAYEMLRKFGLGIADSDLAKIPVGIEERFEDTDTDKDGLADRLEEGLGTNLNLADTDGDGISDGQEVRNGNNPLGTGKMAVDTNLVNRLKGKILLQVQKAGQAWYVNPKDGKRYYMKNGDAAYQIMRFLSLGITNSDLNKISSGEVQMESNTGSDSSGSQNNFTDTNNCPSATHYENGDCISNYNKCTITNGLGSRKWSNGVWSSCQVDSCNTGYESVNNECVLLCKTGEKRVNGQCTTATRSCDMAHGTGIQYLYTTGKWSECYAVTCDAGYGAHGTICDIMCLNSHEENGVCVDNARSCVLGSNSQGQQDWVYSDSAGWHWTECYLAKCDPGYRWNGVGYNCVKEFCTDSDGGLDYDKKGQVTDYNNVPVIDECGSAYNSSELIEFYCDGTTMLNKSYICPNGCVDGACLPVVLPDVTNVEVTYIDNHQVSIRWDSNIEGNGEYRFVDSGGNPITSWTSDDVHTNLISGGYGKSVSLLGLDGNTTYYVEVRKVLSTGQVGESDIISFTTEEDFDLSIKSVEYKAWRAADDYGIKVTVTKDKGDSVGAYIDLYVNGVKKNSKSYNYFSTSESSYWFDWDDTLLVGTYEAEIIIDSTDAHRESDEANNSQIITIKIE